MHTHTHSDSLVLTCVGLALALWSSETMRYCKEAEKQLTNATNTVVQKSEDDAVSAYAAARRQMNISISLKK